MLKGMIVLVASLTLISSEWSGLNPGAAARKKAEFPQRKVEVPPPATKGVLVSPPTEPVSLAARTPERAPPPVTVVEIPELVPPPVVAVEIPELVPFPVEFDETKEWLKLQRDFAVKVEMIGGVEQAGGRRFDAGNLVQFEITPARDCWVSVWSLNGDGTVDHILPHASEPDDVIRADQTERLPRKVSIEMTPSVGTDQAWILVSDRPWGPVLEAKQLAELQKNLNHDNFHRLRKAVSKLNPRMKLSETMIPFVARPTK